MAEEKLNTDSKPVEAQSFLSWPAARLMVGRALPGNLFFCIGHRMIRYKHQGDEMTQADYDKLLFNRVKFVFVDEEKKAVFRIWSSQHEEKVQEETYKNVTVEQKPIVEAAIDLRRAALDLFANPTGDEQSKAAVHMSKKMVAEFLKKPYVLNSITQLQRYDRGCADHSVNVSVLSVFLGLRMGYTSQVILEHLSIGGLLHDIGKTLLTNGDGKTVEEDDPRFLQHPILSKQSLENNPDLKEVANEVSMIVAQHHEFLDGTGYPNRLRGLAIYDLARIVAIANLFDNLVSKSTNKDVVSRVKDALDVIERDYKGKLDPKKLEKTIKIIRYGLT